MADINKILAVALIVGIPLAAIIGVLLSIFWLFGIVNTYIAIHFAMTGALLWIVSAIATLIIAWVTVYLFFWFVVIIIILGILVVGLLFSLFEL
ncbi:MAG: hypothetical protein ACYCS1_05065 [Gammaproteobacteria bacterium]